jgi:hypothetical protein
MTRPGKPEDLVALRLGKPHKGSLNHNGCGKIIYAGGTRDAYLCQGCQTAWPREAILKEIRSADRTSRVTGYQYTGPELTLEEE